MKAKSFQRPWMKGFTLDLLPCAVDLNNGGCGQDDKVTNTFTASTDETGSWLRQQASFLAVQAFIPKIYLCTSNENDLIRFKWAYLQAWIDQRLPVMLDVDPGYDAHVVFSEIGKLGQRCPLVRVIERDACAACPGYRVQYLEWVYKWICNSSNT